MSSTGKEVAFDLVISDVSACRICPRMCESKRVLNRGCGPLSARVMIVGEAPGRLGADASELPFHGDKAGHNFESLVELAGLRRSNLFITNAVLCNPKDEAGNNATPTETEIVACASFLKRQIDVLQPTIVATLGAVALRATSYIEQHGLKLREAIRSHKAWYGRELVPLYHPGQRAMIHRSFANQSADYQYLAERIRRSGGKTRAISGKAKPDIARIAAFILQRGGARSYFSLHKLAYLAEYQYARNYGRRMTDAYYIRQKDGPYCVDLHPERLKRAGAPIEVLRQKDGSLRFSSLPSLFDSEQAQGLLPEESLVLEEIVARYGDLDEAKLKTVTYLTRPMRDILRHERSGVSRFNAPISFVTDVI